MSNIMLIHTDACTVYVEFYITIT